MAIEINELVIRAVVDQAPVADAADAVSELPALAAGAEVVSAAIVEECVRQVLRILARRRER